MQVRTRHTPGISDQSDDLTALHSVANSHQRLAQVEVRRDNATAVIDVDDVAGEEKVVDERDYSTVCCAYRLADGAAEVDAEVAGGEAAVEQSPRAELAGYHRGPGPEKRRGPHRWALVRPTSDLSRSRILTVDSCQGCRVEGTREAAVDLERLCNRWR